MKTSLIATCAILMSLVGAASASPIITFIGGLPSTGTDARILQVTEVDIDGTMYDATFYHGISYDSFSAIAGITPITFATFSTALVAQIALAETINTLTIDASGTATSTGFVFTPFGTTPNNANVTSLGQTDTDPLAYASLNTCCNGQIDLGLMISSTEAYVSFAPSSAAIPEPGQVTLFLVVGVAALAFGGWRRRKKRTLSNRRVPLVR